MKPVSMLVIVSAIANMAFAQQHQMYHIENDLINLKIVIQNNQLHSENIGLKNSLSDNTINYDGNFSFEIVWTDWLAPGMHNNAENPAVLTKKDFKFIRTRENSLPTGINQIELLFTGVTQHLQLLITYQTEPGKYYIKRKIAIRDTLYTKHLLHKVNVFDTEIKFPGSIIIANKGGFGQPAAVRFNDNGFFAGLESPISTNRITCSPGNVYKLCCSKYCGTKIRNKWNESDWAVLGITPDPYVKKWFLNYVNDIKISSDKPYLLYNSWYDLRGSDYPVGTYVKILGAEDYMNKKNVLRLYRLFCKNFVDKYNITLNAFVMDDGWDIYESDWQLRKSAFPDGLSSIADTLIKKNIGFGIWFGPSGGYSARMRRVNWYRDNGYEVVGEEKKWGGAQLCLAGRKYSALLKKRTTDFVKQGLSYFKLDGIQFSCSEQDHGHPIGLYSHVAIFDTLVSILANNHRINPRVYHSITSGTWLSPWWLKYANQIWMQGEDYGYAAVPSYSARDAAITYRDMVLYDDLHVKKFWFPVSNMMTHGIIKGKLEDLHLKEPIDKFSDNALLYFARGVSMYELYTSPDIMSESEWKVIAQSYKWAEKNFDILMNTEMAGGNPGRKQAYGYVHFKGERGIIAARNPYIKKQILEIVLTEEFGISTTAKDLVLEKVYPYRKISTNLFQHGDTLSFPIDGYETAVYEIYPLQESTEPLIAGAVFSSQLHDNGNWTVNYYDAEAAPIILNKHIVKNISSENKKLTCETLPVPPGNRNSLVRNFSLQKNEQNLCVDIDINADTNSVIIGFLLQSADTHTKLPAVTLKDQARILSSAFNGNPVGNDFTMPDVSSGWYTIETGSGKHHIELDIEDTWQGIIDVWLLAKEQNNFITIEIETDDDAQGKRILPYRTLQTGELKKNIKLGGTAVFE